MPPLIGQRPVAENLTSGRLAIAGQTFSSNAEVKLRRGGLYRAVGALKAQALRRLQESGFLSEFPELVLDALKPLGDRWRIEAFFGRGHDRCDLRP